jgi:hypothetical protein
VEIGNPVRPRRAIGFGLQDIWRAMERLNKSGKAKSVRILIGM